MKKWIGTALAALVVFYICGRTQAEVKNMGNTGETIVAFGDSLTYGYGAPRGSDYPSLLAQKTARPVVNFGQNGATGVQAPQRLEDVLEQHPYMVLIEFGGNDFMRGVPFEQTLSAVSQIVEKVQQAGAIAVLVDTGGYGGMSHYSKAYRKLAKEKGAVFVPGILDGIFGKRSLMSDQVHPNAEGYALVADKVYKHIKEYL